MAQALRGDPDDPVVGPVLEFRVVGHVPSVDVPGVTNFANVPDQSQVPAVFTEQIPVVTPVRTRLVQFGRSGKGDSRQANGQCVPIAPRTRHSPGPSR